MTRTISINRAPVLTLGRAVAGLNAYSKGVRLGLFTPAPEEVREKRKALRPKETITVDLLQRAVPAVHTKDGLRAISKEKAVDPESVERYVFTKFGEGFDDALGAMRALAKSRPPLRLAGEAYHLYEKFRPSVPAGTRGWRGEGDARAGDDPAPGEVKIGTDPI